MVERAQEVIAALSAVHDPHTSVQQRAAAQEFCTNLEKDFNLCFNLGRHFFLNYTENHVRHFGLHLWSQSIKHHWNRFNSEQRGEMKLLSFQLPHSMKGIHEEPPFIKEKLVSVWMELAKRDWPQEWPDMIPRALELCQSKSPLHTELVLMFLRSLADTARNATKEEMPRQRRLDILDGLHNSLGQIFPLFFKIISLTLSQESKENKCLLFAVLEALVFFLGWVPHAFLFAHNFGPGICNLLVHLETRLIGCECLLEMFLRKGKPDERVQMMFIFDKLELLWTSLSLTDGDEDADYLYHKSLTQLLSLMGNLLVDLRNIAQIPAAYSTYLSLMLKLLQYPSVLLRSYTVPFWNNLLQHGCDTKALAPPDDFLRQLLTAIIEALSPVAMDENADDPLHVHLADDFGEDEWEPFIVGYMSQLQTMARGIASVSPLVSFRLLAEAVNSFGTEQVTTKFIQILKATFAGITTEVFEQQSLTQAVMFILDRLMRFSPGDSPLLKQQQAEALFACSLYFCVNKDGVLHVVRKNFDLLASTDGTVSTNVPHKRVIHQLNIKLAQEHADTLLPHFDAMSTLVSSLLEAPTTARADTVFYMEFLTAVTNAKKSFDAQRVFIERITSSPLQKLGAEGVQRSLASLENFVAAISSAEGLDYLQQIFNSINTVHKVATKSKIPTIEGEREAGGFYADASKKTLRYPIETSLRQILPTVLKVCKLISLVFTPAGRQLLPTRYHAALMPEAHSLRDLIHQYHLKHDVEIDPESRRLQVLLTELRTFCYRLIHFSMVILPDFYQTPPTLIYESLFQNLDHCDAFQMRSFLRSVAGSFFSKCPEEHLGTYLPLLDKFILYMNERIAREWIRASQVTENSTQEDILNDKLVRIITVEYSQMLFSLAVDDEGKFTEKNLANLANILIANQAPVLNTYIQSTISILTKIPDAACQRICSNLLIWLIPNLLGKAPYANVLSNDVLSAFLQALARVDNDLHTPCLKAVEQIYCSPHLAAHRQQMSQLLVSICEVAPGSVEQLNRTLSSISGEKQRRNLIKKCLRNYVGRETAEKATAENKMHGIRSHREKVFRNKITQKEPVDTEEELNLEFITQ